MSFRKQLLLGIGALTAVTMFCVATAVAALWTSANATSRVTSELVEQLDTTQRLGILSERLIASARGYMLTGEARERQAMADVSDELTRAIEAATRQATDTVQLVHLVAVRLGADRYVHVVRTATQQRVSDARYAEHLSPARLQLTRSVRNLVALETWRVKDLTDRAEKRIRVTGVILVIGCGLGMAIGIALAVSVGRALCSTYASEERAARAASESARARKDLLDMATHDLRSPLHSILLAIDLIRSEHGPIPQLGALEHAAQRMRKLVEGLLDASEAETTGVVLDRQRTTIAALVGATVEMLSAGAARAGISLRVDPLPSDPILVDPERVMQILANLVSNALAFTPRDGQVTISAERHGQDMRIRITDTGPGIPEEERGGLFHSFSQAGQGQHRKRSRRGSVGLGLYIAKSLVVAHGGRIGVDSSIGSGSTFWFELPCDGRP